MHKTHEPTGNSSDLVKIVVPATQRLWVNGLTALLSSLSTDFRPPLFHYFLPSSVNHDSQLDLVI